MFEAHFQAFEDTSERDAAAGRVAALRARLTAEGLDGFVVPHADRYMNEYLPQSEERLAWLTGFTGSAGRALVLTDRAALFIDGRYTLQARDQVDSAAFDQLNVADTTPEQFIEANVTSGNRIGYDPWLHTPTDVERLTAACHKGGAEAVAVTDNPLDAIWTDRPAPPQAPVQAHDLRFSGEDVPEKLAGVQAELGRSHTDALIVSNPASIAWLFNIRGGDVAHTPIVLAFAIVPASGRPALFLDERKVDNATRDYLERFADVRSEAAFAADAAAIGAAAKTVRIDPGTTAAAIFDAIVGCGGKVNRGADPIVALKAVKNPVEIAGSRAAHLRDGAAIANFLAWFDGEAPSGALTEIDCVEALESFRRATGLLEDVSFPTIAGSGPNGAMVHYRVTRSTNRRIGARDLFLLDSGGQYRDGTTDITRTIAVGQPSEDMRANFTRVLKGHIAIAAALFPDGISGAQLDPFARQHLWRVGLDYDHGTGHGVGSYLSVHEGPVSIHKSNLTPIRRGMILSNEPGFYQAGAYGIRIENLVLVVPAPDGVSKGKPLNAFETLTLAPIDRRLIARELMTADEIAWVDGYHARVHKALHPLVEPATRTWLDNATRPLAQ